MAKLAVLNIDEEELKLENLETNEIIVLNIFGSYCDLVRWAKVGYIITGSRRKSFRNIDGSMILMYQIGDDEDEQFSFFFESYQGSCDALARVEKNKLLWRILIDGNKFCDNDGNGILYELDKLRARFPICDFRLFEDCTLEVSIVTDKVKVFNEAIKQVEKYINNMNKPSLREECDAIVSKILDHYKDSCTSQVSGIITSRYGNKSVIAKIMEPNNARV